MRSVGSLVPSRTISCCALLPRKAPYALRPRQTEVLASQAAGQLARRSLSAAGSRPADRRQPQATSWSSRTAPRREPKEREQVAKMPC